VSVASASNHRFFDSNVHDASLRGSDIAALSAANTGSGCPPRDGFANLSAARSNAGTIAAQHSVRSLCVQGRVSQTLAQGFRQTNLRRSGASPCKFTTMSLPAAPESRMGFGAIVLLPLGANY